MTRVPHSFGSKYRQALEEELRQSFTGQEGLLYNMLLYQLGWMDEQGMPLSGLSGHQLHPVLCLMSCEWTAGEYPPALPAAAAVELVHNYSLIHEDVQSGNPNRDNRSTVWWIWGPGQAINAGDGMHALARLSLMRLQSQGLSIDRVLKAMRLLDQSCLNMCEGQHLDLAFQERLDVGVDSYFKMAAARTGSLMSCAMGLGALAAVEDDSLTEAFKRCGENLGIAYQISQDVRELQEGTGDEVSMPNVLNKKKLFPIVNTLEKAELHTKRELGTIYFKRVLEPPDAERVIAILKESSAFAHAKETAEDYCQRALDALNGIDLPKQASEELESFCQDVIIRSGN